MHAIGNQIKMNDSKMKILYISSEKFTNEIINSIQNKNTDAFRKKYRNIDCLIIDDIQFLKNKEMTQEDSFILSTPYTKLTNRLSIQRPSSA